MGVRIAVRKARCTGEVGNGVVYHLDYLPPRRVVPRPVLQAWAWFSWQSAVIPVGGSIGAGKSGRHHGPGRYGGGWATRQHGYAAGYVREQGAVVWVDPGRVE